MIRRIFAAASLAALIAAAAVAVPGGVISRFSLSGNIYPVGAAM
jgi:hypothetical protein